MDKPWLNTDCWPRVLQSSARQTVKVAWGFAAIWNLISWPTALVLPEELARGNMPALLVLLFPLVGLFLLRWAIGVTREWRRFGVTELTLDPYPGSIGGHVGGLIRIKGADSSLEFKVVLECVRSSVKTSGGKHRRNAEVIWQISGPGAAIDCAGGSELRFRFDVPEGLPASENAERTTHHFWRITLTSPQSGIPLRRQFRVGVFATGVLSSLRDVDTSGQAEQQAERTLRLALIDPQVRARLLDEHGLEVESSNGWLRLYLHRGRQRAMAFLSFTVGTAFTAGMLLLPDEGFTTSVMRFAFGAFGIGLILLASYLPFNSLDVRISKRKLKRVRSWFGVRVRSQEITPQMLEELEIDSGSSMTTGNETTIYYELVGKGRFGHFRLMESIPDRMLVEAIREQVMVAAGLRLSATH